MNSNIDKVNMSLDDIIKLEKKQKRLQQTNRNGNQRGPNAVQGQGRAPFAKPGAGQRQKPNQGQKKPFGLLNKSKAIQKKGPPKSAAVRVKGAGPAKANALAAAAAASTLKGRLSGRGVGQQLGKMQNLARIRRRRNPNPPANRVFNRYGGPNVRQPGNPKFQNPQQPRNAAPIKFAKKQAVQPKQPPVRRPPALNKAKADLTKAKIAMQTARKNVQKAKRLLATRKGPIQQIMTQRYAKNLAAKKTKQNNAAVKKAKLIAKSVQARPKSVSLKVSVPNNRKAAVPQVQAKKPVIKRGRPAAKQAPQSGKGSNRMVFY